MVISMYDQVKIIGYFNTAIQQKRLPAVVFRDEERCDANQLFILAGADKHQFRLRPFAAAAMLPGCEGFIAGLRTDGSSLQGDAGFVRVIEACGGTCNRMISRAKIDHFREIFALAEKGAKTA